MEEKKNRTSVDIYGEKFIVKGGSSAEHMRKLADTVHVKMQQIATKNFRLSTSHVAILAALNIADEMQKLQEDYDALVKIIDHDKDSKEVKKSNEPKNQTAKKVNKIS